MALVTQTLTNIEGLSRNILIIGATEGIGLALAHYYDSLGERLILIGNKPREEIQSYFFTPANYCHVDFSSPDCVDVIEKFLGRRMIESIDLLIHNEHLGESSGLDTEDEAIFDSQIYESLRSVRGISKMMLERLINSDGRISLISSSISALGVDDDYREKTLNAIENFADELRTGLGQIFVQVLHPIGSTCDNLELDSVEDVPLEIEKEAAERFAKSIQSDKEVIRVKMPGKFVKFLSKFFVS